MPPGYHRALMHDGSAPVPASKVTQVAPGSAFRVGVVVSRYNAGVTDKLLSGALAVLGEPTIIEAPGAYELPPLAAALVHSGRFDGVLALGCVIKGETDHDLYINHAVAQGLTSIAITTGIPVGFGVLTCGTVEQAIVRASSASEGGGDKGGESARALLATMEQIKRVHDGAARPGARLPLPYVPTDKASAQHPGRSTHSSNAPSLSAQKGSR